MSDAGLFPRYIPREEEEQVRHQADLVQSDGMTRAVLMYGSGGVGKTSLVRELAGASSDAAAAWIDPIDLDDSEYWLLSNLEQKIADQLDPGNRYFARYRDYFSKLPTYTQPHIGHETVVSHLARIKTVFLESYQGFVEDTGTTVILSLDTVEAIRGTNLLLTLTKWMKALPRTLFVLSGRPVPEGTPDPLEHELRGTFKPLPLLRIDLASFAQDRAFAYLNDSGATDALSEEEKAKIVLLTRGHPLWLAFALGYLAEVGIPEEAELQLADIVRDMPYDQKMTRKGVALHEAFKRRLVTPYQGTDFWHEAIKRLAVVRQRVNQPIWRAFMSDVGLPGDMNGDWDKAWERLLELPWVRPRANGRYVTLHDAVAEELALRIIPLHDQDQRWRRRLWRRAVEVYRELTAEPRAVLRRGMQEPLPQDQGSLSTEDTRTLIEEVARLDDLKRELDLLVASRLHYQLLSDPETGCREFLVLIKHSSKQHDVLFQHLIALEMQRFLPSNGHVHEPGDVTRGAIEAFQAWLTSNPSLHLEIDLNMAEYLIDNEQAASAFELLQEPRPPGISALQGYYLSILRGNACMLSPGHVREGENHFLEALEQARNLTTTNRHRCIARAHKELGFYYRNVGLWGKADETYHEAHKLISRVLTTRSPRQDREEMASIQTNWAYVMGLRGRYSEAQNLVESAIAVRRRHGRKYEEGVSWSVCGEVHRYDHQFKKAWAAYKEAEQIFHGLGNWSWLGLVYQEEAICLHQAAETGLDLMREEGRDQYERAELLIGLAMDTCRDQAIRGYPSALNRAGRIYREKDVDTALQYLEEGIEQARKLFDGWFLFANLIEYVEASYGAWLKTQNRAYRDRIDNRRSEIAGVMDDYEFPDLKGRWNLLQGHLIVHDALGSQSPSQLSQALNHYKAGFLQITHGYVGSHGIASIPAEFTRFAGLFQELPPETQAAWLDELRPAWQEHTSLLARLEELY